MKVALVQMEIEDGTKRDRIARAEELIEQAHEAKLVLLPELWNVGYFTFDRYVEESEPLMGETVSRMAAKAFKMKTYILAGSIVERSGDDLYNTTVLLDPAGEAITRYRKIHLFGHDSREKKLVRPGKEVVAIETELGAMGLSTCYDLRFPELYRKQVDMGTELFLVTAAWPDARLSDWQLLNRVRALENQAFLISCNACGINRGVRYGGHSMVINPWGKIVAEAGELETVLQAEVDLSLVHKARTEFPALKDRKLV